MYSINIHWFWIFPQTRKLRRFSDIFMWPLMINVAKWWAQNLKSMWMISRQFHGFKLFVLHTVYLPLHSTVLFFALWKPKWWIRFAEKQEFQKTENDAGASDFIAHCLIKSCFNTDLCKNSHNKQDSLNIWLL